MSHRCVFKQGPMPHEWHMSGPCEGPLQAHHAIPRQTLRQHYSYWNGLMPSRRVSKGLPEALPPIQQVLGDRRNLVPVCRRHHELVSGCRIYVTRPMLPEGIDDFAAELGLSWYMDRVFYREGEVA